MLADAIPIEAAHVMGPDDGTEPVHLRGLPGACSPDDGARAPRAASTFYDMARGPDCALAIATGEQRLYANILLTIGVVMPE